MLQYDFEESVGYWLLDASHSYQRALNEELAPTGVTFRQCQVLGCLALCGPLTQAALAERMGIEPPTLVGILDRMQRDGWVVRRPCPEDRRKNWIEPTAAAIPVWRTIAACARRVRARAVEGLSAEELATLRRLLKKVQDNVGAPAEHRAAASRNARTA